MDSWLLLLSHQRNLQKCVCWESKLVKTSTREITRNPLLSGTVVEAVGHIGLRGFLPLFFDGDEQYIGVETVFSRRICHGGPENILLEAECDICIEQDYGGGGVVFCR